MYDFILFESNHNATHHLYDVELISRMMQSRGLKVAIFDIYREITEYEKGGIPVVHWSSISPVPDDSWMLRSHSLWETIVKSIKLRIQTHRYFKEVKRFITDKAVAFYCGSYYNGISTELFKIQKPCYYWGLRSERMRFSWRKLFPSPLSGLHILLERKMFLKNPYQRLFVSNPIIMDEFEQLGVARNRMVIREERVVETRTDANLEALDRTVSFLVIGQLRKEKHIPITVQAFKEAAIPDSHLKLIGRSQGEYEQVISQAIQGDKRINRVNSFLEYEDFFRYLSSSHFVLFADEEGRSCITNGTMMEALIHHRPVICPDYNPYKYYIEKYGLGLLYKPGDIYAYAEAIIKAASFGVGHFQEKIDKFLETIKFDSVAEQFVSDIKSQMQ